MQIFELPEFEAYESAWITRTQTLSARAGYYDGSVYTSIATRLSPLLPVLYRGIKPLFLPFSRAVDVDAGIVPGGWSLLDGTPRQIEDAVSQVLRTSAWDTQGVLYVHYGAVHGLSGLKVVDDRFSNQIRIVPVDPTRFMVVPYSVYSNEAALSFYIDMRRDETGKYFQYAEVITPERIRTYADGVLMSIGGRPAEYPNDLGIVPYVEVQHMETGDPLGTCTYQRAIEMLNEVNELASYLADIIKKHAEPQWAIDGAEGGDLIKSGDNVWFLPAGSKAQALVAAIDVDGVLKFIEAVNQNVVDALPELSFTELRKRERVATATLELQMLELTLKIQRCRPNYDRGLVGALQLAGRAAMQMGLSDIAILDTDALELDGTRRVLPLDPEVALRIEQMELSIEQQRRGMQMMRELENGA